MSVLEKVRPVRTPAAAREPRATDEHGRRIRVWELALRYLLLLAVLALTVGPFLWQLSTSLKGPTEDIFSSP
ncbi:carbohydrate ABC transporter permease, partial [Streptomyces sp. NPDC052015]